MKKLLDWKSKEVVNIFDEVTLWSAPFGRLLLEQMPMQKGATILDIGFGTGFPLIELSQRFGIQSQIYGIDIWEQGIARTKEKIKILEIENIQILEQSASQIAIEDNRIDIITSNLGVNNFEDKAEVYQEVKRILKQKGRLCITTNPIGTFSELFEVIRETMIKMDLNNALIKLDKYEEHRKNKLTIVEEIEEAGLKLIKSKLDSAYMRFLDGVALLNHSLIRIGFRESWEMMIDEDKKIEFFTKLVLRINEIIDDKREFRITIPILYLEFEKE